MHVLKDLVPEVLVELKGSVGDEVLDLFPASRLAR
jgi:hypothetical protein